VIYKFGAFMLGWVWPGLQEPASSGSVASLTDPVGKDSPTVSCEGDDDGVCLETRQNMTEHPESYSCLSASLYASRFDVAH
jgi:hypothetical protein